MHARDLTFEEIKVGDTASFERTIVESDVRAFAALTGDENPLHVDPGYAATTKFGKPLVHGMLLGGLCSALVGMHLPGKRCLYLSQSLTFKKPVFIGDTVRVQGTVSAKSEATRVLTLALTITSNGQEVAGGTALTQVLE